uniref:COR domain-containing protein n=1 Tax=Magallana gigas TaxID=29159 RepID=A0A8W8J0B2_MAGGI
MAYCLYQQVEKSKDNYENESLLKDNPEIDDDKLRQFLSKGEITVCHVRCIIVGCAKAGKTTLLKRLQNVSYDELMQIERTEMVDFHVNSFEVLLEEETIQSIEKADTVPTILFSKENLERPLKENDGKMAEEAHQPSIEKADTVPTFLFSKENLEMPLKEKDGIMAVEAHQPNYYKFWLRSIDVFSDTESPVIIVGTHADGLTEEGRREFPESLLKFFDECCHSDHKRHINADRMYAIGFPDSGSELEDLKKIKKCIANIVKSPRYSKENIRPVWALFEHILNIMKENRKVISRKTLSDYIDQLIAQEFRIDDSEISKMLDFFHRVGVLLYFDKDGLKENIILDIQWLLDAFKCIIDYPVNPEKPDIKRRLFYQTGELDNVELDRIWNVEGKDFLKHKTTIIAYMQQLGLLMPLKELHPIDSNVYYCPSMNSKRFDKTGEHNSKSSILCFKFDEEMQLQINVFYGIVLKCSKLNNWSISTYRQGNKNNICLYQNTACFSFREHNVVLCNCNFEIRVQVWALPEIYDGRLLKKIKHSVEDIIHDVGLSYEIGYKCRKDVLNDEKDVSFISQSIFPVSNYVKCETCEIDKNHVVKNDICWELEVNDENQVAESTVPVKENVEDATAKGDGSSVILDKNTEEVMEQKPTKKNDEDVEDKDQDDSVAVTKIAEEETVENSSLCLEMEDDATSASPLQEMQSKLDGSEVSKVIVHKISQRWLDRFT